MIFEAKKISKYFDKARILNNVDISVEKGEIISICGASGSGKTTLLNILGLIDLPTQGMVEYYNNLRYDDFKSRKRVNTIGYIFQFHHLLSEFNVVENLVIPQLMSGKNHDESLSHATELLDFIDLESISRRYPSEISGGERQRIAVLRGIINRPEIVFADEPTGNLDNDNSLFIIKLLSDLRDKFNISFVIATHDTQVTKFSEKTFYISDGELKKTL